MTKPIAFLPESAEFLSIEGWNRILSESEIKEVARHLTDVKDPLGYLTFPGVSPIAVYGFDRSAGSWSLVYFWSEKISDQAEMDWQKPSGELFELLNLGLVLSDFCDEDPGYTFELLRSVYSERNIDFSFASKQEDVHLYWSPSDDLRFAAIYSTNGGAGTLNSDAIGRCLSFHLDYFWTRTPIRRGMPLSYLMQRCGRNSKQTGRVLLQPKCFEPNDQSTIDDRFLWPWQQSMRLGDKDDLAKFRAIPTTSLVFDIRKSTMVLEQLQDSHKGQFPAFIRKMVEVAKGCVFRNGGFFDKETGDGIVAHFCNFDLGSIEIETPSLRAFNAACEILQEIDAVCSDIQHFLDLGVGGLGGSIGLHSSKAVWSCDEGLITALGNSVILAARLCSEADNGAIFVSNSEYYRLIDVLPPEVLGGFVKAPYSGKEWNSGAKLFGMMFSTGRSKPREN